MKKKSSLKDIAKKVGVSIATVSYVMNNKEKEARVGEDVAARIRKAALQLDYKPNFIAKSLKSGKTNTIGLIVADISNPFFSTLARIIEDEARKHGYIVLFGSSDEKTENLQSLIEVFINRQVDAFIIAPTADAESQIKFIQEAQIPVVLIDRYFPNLPTDVVRIDNEVAAFNAVRHLLALGRKKIGMVAYKTTLPHMKARIDGYKKALKNAGIRLNASHIVKADYQQLTKEVGDGVAKLLRNSEKIDALFFATNTLAVAGLKKIVELNIKVPEDLAIVSFDESEAFDFFYSPITYMRQSMKDIGKESVALVIKKLGKKLNKSETIIVDAHLVQRDSCGINLP
ncbi:MAG: LacI family DNA-binding transcriptional regulator [Chitinophagaceae bacterium]